MNKKKILGVILLSILFVLAGCSKKELSKIEMIEGSYNTDLGLITISKDKTIVGFGGSSKLHFREDDEKFLFEEERKSKDNEAWFEINLSYYRIAWSDSDKSQKVDNITITNTYNFRDDSDKKSEKTKKKYSGVRVQNK